MRLSVLDSLEIPQGGSSADGLGNAIALARFADELGLTRYWITEHHGFGHELCPSPEVLVGALAGATTRIRVGAGGMLVNRHNPYCIAQAFRTLEALHPGRIDLGLGRSAPGINAEAVFQRNAEGPEDHAQRVEEILRWLSHEIAEDGPLAGMRIMPDLPPGPAPWLLAASVGTAELAARLGAALACSGFHKPEITPDIAAAYTRAFHPSSYAATGPASACLIAVIAIAAETTEEAERLAMPVRMAMDVRMKQGAPLRQTPSIDEAVAYFGGIVPAEQGDWPSRVIGSYDEVAERIRRMGARTGVSEVMIRPFTAELSARMAMYRNLAARLG
ncbi:MAG: hypothetical protein ABS76_00770 [Pelagibacterium sp. SCN 64-44]|nr:MAG: hypothetical protein ABS76_00770 [Pelagibacterium sp. SCN 64-44]